jgi:NADPH:quinone reductase-like Zn-dependent oxidoreductase
MKAVLLHEYGGPEQLKYEETGVPAYGADEVLVRMKATSLNPIDWKLRSGSAKARFPLQLPAILGRDLSGEIAEVGSAVNGFKKGARVIALANGTYAQYAVAKAEILAVIPESMTFENAAALPLVTTTGSQLIERAVKPKEGEKVLVTGALGGVGRTAVHVARQHGAHVIAGVRSHEKEEAGSLGAHEVVAIDDLEEIGALHDLDAIADTVGGTTIQRLYKALRKGGVIGSVLGEPPGAKEHDIRVEAFMAMPDAARLSELAQDIAQGQFTIPIARTMKLAEIQEAQQLGEKGGTGGKIIILIP